MTGDDIIGTFLYGLGRLRVDDNGLTPDNDPDMQTTVGALCVAVYRVAAGRDATPFDMALSRLAVLTGGLLVTPTLGHGPDIVRKWLIARSEVLELQLAANNK
jgi:hypothetical protein